MTRLITLLRLVAVPTASLVAVFVVGACGSEDPNPPTAGTTGGNSGSGGAGGSGATGGTSTSMGGSGGSMGGSGGSMGGSTGGGSADSGLPPAAGDYFPFKVGNRWTFRITEPGGVAPYLKEQVVVRMEKVGGKGPHKDHDVFRVETRKMAPAMPTMLEDATISWQAREGNKVLRYRETSCTRFSAMMMNDTITSCSVDVEDYWDPPRVRIDELPMGTAPAENMTWPERYTEFKDAYDYTVTPPFITSTTVMNTDTWRVVNANVSVTVPAGTFNNCVVLQKMTSSTFMLKTYTFCRGIGKVKEVGLGQTEELAILPTLK